MNIAHGIIEIKRIFNMLCPKCTSEKTDLLSSTYTSEVYEYYYHCSNCGHLWAVKSEFRKEYAVTTICSIR